MEEMNHYKTEEGTLQGGIFSPLLCNVTLNGIEKITKELHPLRRGISAGVHTIRYADDIVVTGKNPEVLHECREEVIAKFLTEMGLELSEKKTKVIHVNKDFIFWGSTLEGWEKSTFKPKRRPRNSTDS